MLKTNEIISVNVCIWDWKSYNNGEANWVWFELPSQLGDLEEHLCELEEQGLEEPFICDTDGWSHVINEYTSINKLLDTMLDIERMDRNDLLQEHHEATGYSDEIYSFDSDTLEVLFGNDLANFANRIHFGRYNAHDPYFYLDGYANIVTIPEHKKEELESSYIQEVIESYLK